MNRRKYLTTVCSVGIIATAGCSTVGDEETLLNPTVDIDSSRRKALIFTANDEEVGSFGVNGAVESGRIALSTEIWHRDGTTVESITLRPWMPETAPDTAAEVAVVSPVEGDSSPPPAVALYTPEQTPGTVIEITELDDLADETISTINLRIKLAGETATTLKIHATIELAGSGVLSTDYTLDGELEVAYPALANQ